MTTPPDLSAALDDAIGDGPPLPPVADHVVPGRRAVRRRRTAVLAGGGLAAAILVGGTVLATAGGGITRVADPAGDPTADASPTEQPTEQPDDETDGTTAVDCALDPRDEVDVADGATVLDRVDNPLGRTAPRRSYGLEVRFRGETGYWLLDCAPRNETGTYDPVGKNAESLREWLALQEPSRGTAPTDGLLRFGADGTLAPGPGATILDQRSPVDVGERFAAPGSLTAAALVERDGTRWWVLTRRTSTGPAEYFPISFRAGGEDMAEFLGHATEQYSGGEGLR